MKLNLRNTNLNLNDSGQAMAEYIIVLPVLLLLILGAIQFSLIFMAKSTLNEATFYAVRKGTLNNANFTKIQEGLAEGLAPLYQNSFLGTNLAMAADAEANAFVATENPSDVCIQVLNPNNAAFNDFGVSVASGTGGASSTEIPNVRLLYKSTQTGSDSDENIQDANLLKIRVNYCYSLIVPFIGKTLETLADTGLIGGMGAWQLSCYNNNGIPLVANSTMLMQTPAIKGNTSHSSCF